MPFTLIKGTFHVKGYSPDGDSIRFMANDSTNWQKLSGQSVKRNAKNHAQLRFEAIDALETHFEDYHQPLNFAEAAQNFLLKNLGITDIKWNPSHSHIIEAKDGTEGFILARSSDKYGRPIAFVFEGKTDSTDGEQVVFKKTDPLFKKSLNYALINEGLVYPTYYKGLFNDLRDEITKAVAKVRTKKKGLWAQDKTNAGFIVTDLKELTENDVVLPKLFRRLVDYMKNGGNVSRFKEYLDQVGDSLIIFPRGQFTHLDTIVEVNGDRVTLEEAPENLVFME